MGELVPALRASAPDLFKSWLPGGVQDLDEHQKVRRRNAVNGTQVDTKFISMIA